MTDIVERLRNSLVRGDDPNFYMLRNQDIAEAAGEIARLRAAFQVGSDTLQRMEQILADGLDQMARAALEPKP